MIHFGDNEKAKRVALHANPEHIVFVRDDCEKGYIAIPVENLHVIRYRNFDNVFSSYLFLHEVDVFHG